MDSNPFVNQAFYKGDLVRIADDLGPSMRHFEGGCDAIVIGSYADQYGGTDRDNYTLHLKGRGTVSWYYAHQLTLIERGRGDLLAQWEREEAEEDKLHADLDWVFANGDVVCARPSGVTVAALVGCRPKDLWGSRGEGVAYYENCYAIMSHAEPFLRAGDKDGWIAYRTRLLAA